MLNAIEVDLPVQFFIVRIFSETGRNPDDTFRSYHCSCITTSIHSPTRRCKPGHASDRIQTLQNTLYHKTKYHNNMKGGEKLRCPLWQCVGLT